MSEMSLENTGLFPFIETGKKLAVAHKLGGDNMRLLDANRQTIEILGGQGITQSFAVSAFRSSAIDFNTTSKLIYAGTSQDSETIIAILAEISDFHSTLLEEIFSTAGPKLRARLIDYAKGLFEAYKSSLKDFNPETCLESSDYMVGVGKKTFSLLGVGEVIAAKVFVQYLQDSGIPAVYIDTTDLSGISPQNIGSDSRKFLQGAFERIFQENPNAIPIVPGYIGGIEGGILSRLGRGYTDFTGAQSAIALYDTKRFDAVLLYIQKLYGFKSTDPRALSNPGDAKSVNHLSYDLVSRAISHKGASAGLINTFALSEEIRRRNIKILVGNPTDTSDIAVIDRYGNPNTTGVELVLGRDYNTEFDNPIYGRRNPECHQNHVIYLMGDNIGNLGNIFQQANQILNEAGVEYIAGELRAHAKPELSYVFRNKEDAIQAQRALHEAFINP